MKKASKPKASWTSVDQPAPEIGSRWRHWDGKHVARITGAIRSTHNGVVIVKYTIEGRKGQGARFLYDWPGLTKLGKIQYVRIP